MGAASSSQADHGPISLPPDPELRATLARDSEEPPVPPTPGPAVADDAMDMPLLNKLAGRRVVLASASPRRRHILATIGLHPEVIPSTFKEDLPKSEFKGEGAYEYPVETSSRKALEVYERLHNENVETAPSLVIAADTVVIKDEEIMEKPLDDLDNMRMLAELNESKCEVVTGVTFVHPILTSPGYRVRSLMEKTTVHFAQNGAPLLEAYVRTGEGRDRAGGFAIQGKGGVLVRSIEGDWNNVVGFPLHSFVTMLNELIESDELDFSES